MIKHLLFVEAYKQRLGHYEGISETEIQELEKDFDVSFPASYREYLLSFGKESGYLLSAYYTELKYLRENKEDVISEVGFKEEFPVKDSYFFFAQWQSYVFYFFDCAENSEDPPVKILRNDGKMEAYKPSFSIFLKEEGIDPYDKL